MRWSDVLTRVMLLALLAWPVLAQTGSGPASGSQAPARRQAQPQPQAQPEALGCDQMVAAAQAGIVLRDQGASLSRVLAELERPELRERLSTEDHALLRRALQMTYTREVSIPELAETCNASRGRARR